MKIIYLFYWSQNLGYTYGYGAQIEFFSDQSVRYANRLAMPGKNIYSWTLPVQAPEAGPLITLPFLDTRKVYTFSINGTIIPRDSLGVEINFYNADNFLIDHLVIEGREGEIEFPPGAKNYSLQLVSFGNQSFIFRNLVLGERETLSDYQVTLDDNQPIVIIGPAEMQETSQLKVQLMRPQMPIQPIEFEVSTTTVAIFPPHAVMGSSETLERFATKTVMSLVAKFNRNRLSSASITTGDKIYEPLVDLIESRLDSAFSMRADIL